MSTTTKNKKYKTIIQTNGEIFDEVINYYLQQGWELHGEFKLLIGPSGTSYLTHSIVKYQEQ